jgi:hypothetical protein
VATSPNAQFDVVITAEAGPNVSKPNEAIVAATHVDDD